MYIISGLFELIVFSQLTKSTRGTVAWIYQQYKIAKKKTFSDILWKITLGHHVVNLVVFQQLVA